MELNGISNIKNILHRLEEKIKKSECVNKDIEKMQKQLVLLERYLLALDATNKQKNIREYCRGMFYDMPEAYISKFPHELKVPAWHDVLAHPESFPTLKELQEGKKHE